MIFHITNETLWQKAALEGAYSHPSLASEGFIHCSEREQVLGAAGRYFAGQDHLLLLAIDPERLVPEPVWENTIGGEELFPHIYGTIALEAVIATAPLVRDSSGAFVFPTVMA